MDAALRKGRDLPQWYLDEPPRQSDDPFYMGAFWVLSTTRRYELGPIPWDRILLYARHVGLMEDMVDGFTEIVRTMDTAYREWSVEEAKKTAG